ncbi:hypothetical protein [Nocardioides solisilvae]|uniref:hypothetical protein n=1 Tax=Nocardioides solisilvae TaxID=1542435 RepID=UPI0013A5B721|nr:hypothetical protein [Nocardioides solisilvae]
MAADLFLALGGVALLGATVVVKLGAHRRGGAGDRRLASEAARSRESTRALAARLSWRVQEEGLADRRPPEHLAAELATMTHCLAVVEGDDFVAETWAGHERRRGAALAHGLVQHVLRIAAPGVTGSQVVAPVPGPYSPVLLPRAFKGRVVGPVVGPGHDPVLAGGDVAGVPEALAPLVPALLAERCLLVTLPGEVVLTSVGEPEAAGLERRLALGRDAAAWLSRP